MILSKCKLCQKEIIRNGSKPGIFCNLFCKGEWQKTQKPFNKEWLIQKYIIEELSNYKIAKIVKRNPKQVWNWLKGYNIKTRTVQEELEKNAYRHKVTNGEVPPTMLGKHHSNKTKKLLRQQRKGKIPVHICGKNSFLYGKYKELNPQWKGDLTPEREALYTTRKWKNIYKFILIRDKFKCQKCNKKISKNKNGKSNLCVHHIASFSDYPKLRCKKDNLILLCNKCHTWVHSNKNNEKKYLK